MTSDESVEDGLSLNETQKEHFAIMVNRYRGRQNLDFALVLGMKGIIENLQSKSVALSQTIEAQSREIAALENAFRHIHKAKYVEGKLVDSCDTCDLDLRNNVHALRSSKPVDAEKK